MNEHNINIKIKICNKISELKQVLHTHGKDRLYTARLYEWYVTKPKWENIEG